MMMNDVVVARLRTAVPALWGAAITALLAAVALPVQVADVLNSEVVVVAVVAGVTALWHLLWTRVGPHIPDWLETLVMGHTGQASYGGSSVPLEAGEPEDDEPVPGDAAEDEPV